MSFELDNIGTFIIRDHERFEFDKFILGSSSPRRVELVSEFIKDFEIIKPEIDEKSIIENFQKNNNNNFIKNSFLTTSEVALQKAIAVYKKKRDGLILSADTVVITDNSILGKPISLNDAKTTLHSLLGNYHYVCTAVCLLNNLTDYKHFYVVSGVKFVEESNFVNDFIDSYVKSLSPIDKAGSYNIKEVDKVLIDSIYGDYYNIVGLPLVEFLRSIKLWKKMYLWAHV